MTRPALACAGLRPTTTNLTSSLSHKLAALLGLSSAENAVEFAVRGLTLLGSQIFFALNLTFNGIVSPSRTRAPTPAATSPAHHLARQMWTLFTTALAKGTSTTQVSIMNTSTNFVLTALLGLLIFSEALPPLWWAGAALLVAGNVIVGRKDETKDGPDAADGVEAELLVGDPDRDEGLYKDAVDEDVVDLGDLSSEADG
ncbi:Uncharacterized protein TCAP_03536 [Tolypocladium capitatum]|uniref:Transmembrane protein n=1 Tax=Tolypocladium capitatum TaxID=45235 RepID=A0A2K3QGA1_9HYPO|nr:Uncharacterized protein TCAP_03536 [Tolypocladium capitatum]